MNVFMTTAVILYVASKLNLVVCMAPGINSGLPDSGLPSDPDSLPAQDPILAQTVKAETQDVSKAVTESAATFNILALDTTVSNTLTSPTIVQNPKGSMYILAWPNTKLKSRVSPLHTGSATNVVDCAVLCFRNLKCTSFSFYKQYCCLYQSFNVRDIDAVAGYNTFVKMNI